MPKTILLIRHAKPQPFGLVRNDFDRSLDPRGVLEAKKPEPNCGSAGFIRSSACRVPRRVRFTLCASC